MLSVCACEMLLVYMEFTTLLLVVASSVVKSAAREPPTLMCYTCQYTGTPGADPSCLTRPDKAPIPNTANCGHDRVCTVMLQWSVRENVLRSFYRGCGVPEKQHDVTTCQTDIYFKTCTRACDSDHCNDQLDSSLLQGKEEQLTGGASQHKEESEESEVKGEGHSEEDSLIEARSRPRLKFRGKVKVEARTSAAVTSALQMTPCLIGACVTVALLLNQRKAT